MIEVDLFQPQITGRTSNARINKRRFLIVFVVFFTIALIYALNSFTQVNIPQLQPKQKVVKVTQALKQKKHFSDLSVNDEELAGRRPVRLQSENTEIQGCASTQSETTDKHSKHGQHFEIKGIITAVDHAVVLLQGPSEMLSISSEIRKTNQTLLANRSESTGVQPQDKTVFINDESVTVYFQGCRLEFNF